MRIEIDTKTRTVRINNDAGFEQKHPRDNDGKFAHTGTITVRGNELAGFGVSGAELRMAAVDYYKKHLAGTTVKHPELGEIIFSQSGYKKPVSFSADERKLRLFPFLPEMIKQGKLIESEKDRDGRRNISKFYVLRSHVKLNGKEVRIRVNVREDNQGNLYYDHVIAKEKSLEQRSGPATNPAEISKGVNNSIEPEKWIVNLFIDNQ